MTSHEIASLVTAFDGVRELDACSREQFVAAARWMLEQRPDTLAMDLADRIRIAGPTLALKKARATSPLSTSQSLRYVAQCALDPYSEPAPTTRAEHQDLDSSRAEEIFKKHERRQYKQAKVEWEKTQAERAQRPLMPDYAPPSVVSQAFRTAIETWPRRPSWSGQAPPPPRPAFEPNGVDNQPDDVVVRGEAKGHRHIETLLGDVVEQGRQDGFDDAEALAKQQASEADHG